MRSLKKILFYIKYSLFRRKSIIQFSKLLNESKLSEIDRQKLIFKKLKNIVLHAYNSSNFYNKKYSEYNFNPYQFYDFEMFKNIPVVTKSDLRENNLLIENFDKKLIKKSTTGGSTGVPVSVYHDKSFRSEVFGWFILSRWGAHISDNAGFLERYNPSKGFWGRVNKIIWWPTRRVHLDINILNDEVFLKFYKNCKAIKVVYLEGYVGAVYEFALFLEKNHLKLDNLRFVWTTSAPLTEKARISFWMPNL